MLLFPACGDTALGTGVWCSLPAEVCCRERAARLQRYNMVAQALCVSYKKEMDSVKSFYFVGDATVIGFYHGNAKFEQSSDRFFPL